MRVIVQALCFAIFFGVGGVVVDRVSGQGGGCVFDCVTAEWIKTHGTGPTTPAFCMHNDTMEWGYRSLDNWLTPATNSTPDFKTLLVHVGVYDGIECGTSCSWVPKLPRGALSNHPTGAGGQDNWIQNGTGTLAAGCEPQGE